MPSTTSQSLNSMMKPPFHRMVQAVAGAGKTTDLIGTFIRFCEEFHQTHQRYPKVVLCTFTRKATLEIRERIHRRLLAENKLELYFHVQNQNHVLISTIHGVFFQLLQSCFQKPSTSQDSFQFDPQIQLKSSQDFQGFKKSLLRHLIFSSAEHTSLLEHFKFQQILDAFETLISNTAATAIPYTKEMIESEVIQSLKEFQQSSRQLTSLLQPFELEKWKNVCANLQILTQIPLHTDVDVQKFFQAVQNFKQNVKSRPLMSKKEPELTGDERDLYEAVFSARDAILKNPLYRGTDWDLISHLNLLFNDVFERWSRFFRDHQMETSSISFQDLEYYVMQVLQKNDAQSDTFIRQWDYWMIDEYQDTSPLQNLVLNKLTSGKPQFVVGDPQQSIYYFRGADQTLFDLKKQQMDSLSAQFELKQKNHRSHPDLIKSFNLFFERRDTKTQFTEMTPFLERPSHFQTQEPRTQVLLAEVSEDWSDAHLALYRCLELNQQGVDLRDICILAKNNSSLQKFTQAANHAKIPVQLYSSRGFAEQREVLDLMSYLKFLLNPHDDLNYLTLLRAPYIGLSDQKIFEFCQTPRETNVSLFDSTKDKLAAENLNFLLTNLEQSATTSLIDMAYDYILHRGMLHLANETDLSHQSHSNLFKFVDLMEEYMRTSPGYWFGFFDQLSASQFSDQDMGAATPTMSSSRIHAMTIHASKGLEFDHVILIGCDRKSVFSKTETLLLNEKTNHFSLTIKNNDQENLVPLSLKNNLQRIQLNEKAELERTFYVAVTRAKETLTLCGRKTKTLDPNCYFQFVAQELQTPPESEMIQVRQFTEMPSLEWTQSTLMSTTSRVQPLVLSNAEKDLVKNPSQVSGVSIQLQLKHLVSAQTGIQLHKYLQALQHQMTQSEQMDLELWLKNQAKTMENKHFPKMIQFLWQQKEIPFVSILKKGHSEWSFEYRNEAKQTVRGQIDLWAQIEDEVWLVDYKSGFGSNMDAYRTQLGLYENALRRIFKFDGKIHQVIIKIEEMKILRL